MKKVLPYLMIVLATLLSGCGSKLEPVLPALPSEWRGPKQVKIPGEGTATQWFYMTDGQGDNLLALSEGGLVNSMLSETSYLEAVRENLKRDAQYNGASFRFGDKVTAGNGSVWHSMIVSLPRSFEQSYWTTKMGNRKMSVIHTLAVASPYGEAEKADLIAFLKAVKFKKP